jgi:hypothetical protein
MATDRLNLASIAYWRSNQQPQRFYVALCLFMSSIQDSFLGHKELRARNLNWSATCSYYSLVHAGRLLAFIALGDYPMKHADLRRLLGTVEQRGKQRPHSQDGYPFDWLRGFNAAVSPSSHLGGLNALDPGRERSNRWRDAILEYLTDLGVDQATERLARFGVVLGAAAELRNDSNYEALLIAHEYAHWPMALAFEKLSTHMCDAADFVRSLVVDAFSCFLQRDPDLADNRPEYHAWAQRYLRARLIPGIARKLAGFDDLNEDLKGSLSKLDFLAPGADFSRLEEATTWKMFDGKSQLMKAFQARIEDLARATGSS